MIDRLAKFSSGDGPGLILIFTGGDPMMRRDLFDLIARIGQGLRCSLTPTATALPTLERLEKAMQAGIRRIASAWMPPPLKRVLFARSLVPGSARCASCAAPSRLA